jgi:hypothetical protein
MNDTLTPSSKSPQVGEWCVWQGRIGVVKTKTLYSDEVESIQFSEDDTGTLVGSKVYPLTLRTMYIVTYLQSQKVRLIACSLCPLNWSAIEAHWAKLFDEACQPDSFHRALSSMNGFANAIVELSQTRKKAVYIQGVPVIAESL